MKVALSTIILFFILLINARAADYTRICFRDNLCLQAEIADNDEARKNGLMFREKLAEGQAMLFVFDSEVLPSFWLKNVKFALDIIWINADKTVVDIKTNCQPCVEDCRSYVPAAPAKYAIEVPAGFVEKNQIKAGDRLSFNLP
ncbi:MAG: DUF192 domain-containing protein [Candidatus Omnitrophica bacterium]|nr:DUF192 domain-containing protein [Candidatus Omnitrophota bacterium]